MPKFGVSYKKRVPKKRAAGEYFAEKTFYESAKILSVRDFLSGWGDQIILAYSGGVAF